MTNKTYLYSIVGAFIFIALLIGLGIYSNSHKNSGPDYTAFATCLKDKGVTFYGAFWCPHCRAQKELFGAAVGALPYHECSTPDGNNMLQDCKDKGITGYPTWIYADGSKDQGEQTLQHLSEKTSCTLPTS
jgi:hypothetical protein